MKLIPIETQTWLDPTDPITTVLESGIKLIYPKHLEGGCFWLKDEFVNVIKTIKKYPYKKCLEWCSGLGGIGFEVLGKDLCKQITFSDYYHVAIENCLDNAKLNHVDGRVNGYVSSTISAIPKHEKWNLVIGTPPHCFNGDEYMMSLVNRSTETSGSATASNRARLAIDDGMEIHKEFFQNIKQYLASDADVLLFGSHKQDIIINLALKGDLKFIDVYPIERYGVIYHFKPI